MTRIYAESNVKINGRKVNVKLRDGFCNRFVYGEVNLIEPDYQTLGYQLFLRKFVMENDSVLSNYKDALVTETLRVSKMFYNIPDDGLKTLEEAVRQVIDNGMEEFRKQEKEDNDLVSGIIDKIKKSM